MLPSMLFWYVRLNISASKVSFTLKYSIATFLLCTSAFATGVFIYPVSLAIFSATAIPIFFVAVASISSIIALSSAIYLVKSAVSAINNKNICNTLEEKSRCNDISAKTTKGISVMPDAIIPKAPPPPPFPSQNLSIMKERSKLGKFEDQSNSNAGSNDPRADLLKEIREGFSLKKVDNQNEKNTTKPEPFHFALARRIAIAPPSSESTHSENEFNWDDDNQDIQSSNKKEEKFMSGTEMQKSMPLEDLNVTSSQTKPNSTPFLPLASPLPNQGTSALLPTEDLKNSKPIEDREISKRLFDSASLKNSSFTKSKKQDAELQDKLKKRLEKIEKESEHSQDLSNEKIKDNRDNVKEETRQEYLEEIKKQEKEKNKFEGQNDNGWIHSMILELISPSVKLTDVKKVESSGCSSGYSSDSENHSI